MGLLREFVDHPVALIIAFGISIPFLWEIAKIFFSNIQQDVEDTKQDVPFALLNTVFGGPFFANWIAIKIIYFFAIAAVLVVMFYRIVVWIVEW